MCPCLWEILTWKIAKFDPEQSAMVDHQCWRPCCAILMCWEIQSVNRQEIETDPRGSDVRAVRLHTLFKAEEFLDVYELSTCLIINSPVRA